MRNLDFNDSDTEGRKRMPQSMSQIIQTFNRIKEERHLEAPIQNGKPSRCVRFVENKREVDDQLFDKRTDDCSKRRRVSLPSLFHPFSFSPVPFGTDKNNSRHLVGQVKRRHSVSHVLVEYSKHDLEELAKFHELKLAQMNEEGTRKNQQEDKSNLSKVQTKLPKWIRGSDLHAYYNGWECKPSGSKKVERGERTLKHFNNGEYSTRRSRFNSF